MNSYNNNFKKNNNNNKILILRRYPLSSKALYKNNLTEKLTKKLLKCFLKRKVLSLFKKTGTEELFLISDGCSFHSEVAATEKDLAP